MYIETLSWHFYQCPLPWQNMITKLQAHMLFDAEISAINNELKNFNARYEEKDKQIIFDSEHSYVLWALKWSS
jgi:predicted choloylglycine hydrolase